VVGHVHKIIQESMQRHAVCLLTERNLRPQSCEGIGRYHRPMDCPQSLWPNRVVDWIRREAAYMSENETKIATEESQSGRYAAIEIRRNKTFLKRFARQRLGFTESRRIAYAALQDVIAVGVLIFHSRSILGSVIRALVCS
jgi:hypothetical protein